MRSNVIEQALCRLGRDGSVEVLGRSVGFRDDWLPRAIDVCTRFGERPDGIACSASVFALRWDRRSVAVAQVHDEPNLAGLRFRFLILPRILYRNLGGDPFWLARQFPPREAGAGGIPSLAAPTPPLARSIDEVRQALQRPDAPLLLGAAQALVDGGRTVWERLVPANDLVEALWTLLPTSTRADLAPASFAFGNALGFDVVIVPDIRHEEYDGYLSEEQAEHYPEGRYELGVQTAAEANDAGELGRLFARRSRRETWKLGLTLVVAAVILALSMRLLQGPAAPAGARPQVPGTGKAAP